MMAPINFTKNGQDRIT